MWRLLYFLFQSLLFWISCSPPDASSGYNIDGDDSDVVTMSIAYIKGLYSDYTYLFTSDIIIEGIITANDAYGEFPNSIVIEDQSGAIEIMSSIDCATSGYTVGTTVRVVCSGLYLGSIGGMLSLGGEPYDQTPTSELSQESMSSHVRICDDEKVFPTPKLTTISELEEDDILRYVQIQNLEFVISADSSTTFCTRDETSGQTQYTEHTLMDASGSEITLSVSSYVEYADELIPQGSISIAAIVEYFNGAYSLRIVNRGYF